MRAKIYLEQVKNSNPRKYRVVKLVGSIDYDIGAVLPYKHVADMCNNTGIWEVHVGAEKKK